MPHRWQPRSKHESQCRTCGLVRLLGFFGHSGGEYGYYRPGPIANIDVRAKTAPAPACKRDGSVPRIAAKRTITAREEKRADQRFDRYRAKVMAGRMRAARRLAR